MKIQIPFKTPSVNHLYFNYRGHKILTKEARALKKDIYKIVDFLDSFDKAFYKNKLLQVEIEIYEDWYCKNGAVKKKDVANREKFLIDAIFEALGIDDRFIWVEIIEKVQSTREEKAIVNISVI